MIESLDRTPRLRLMMLQEPRQRKPNERISFEQLFPECRVDWTEAGAVVHIPPVKKRKKPK